jgi:hypothetical protein
MKAKRKPTAAQKPSHRVLARAFNAGWWSGVNLGASGFTDTEISESRLPSLRMFLARERKRR